MEGEGAREISTNLKFGLAVALSLGGALYSYYRIKNLKSPPGYRHHLDSRVENAELKNGDRPSQNPACYRKVVSQNSISDMCSSSRRSGGERECFGLETDDVCGGKKEMEEEENRRLRNRVKILEEKERILELQLLEYYGIKEQENAVMELQNRLRLNTMEAKLYNLKIESLLLDNRRLEAQAADCANSSAELETAKSMIKLLRKKLKSEAERSKDQISKLQDRLMAAEQENKNAEADRESEQVCELKLELEEMKKCNEILKLENIELAQKLEYVQMLAENAVDGDELLDLREESQRLKQENEETKEEMERLKAERSSDQEELIFLRWINACLRNELKNHPPSGKTIPGNLSPKSEERAKKLILEYANKEAKPIDSNYLESDQWSSPCMTDERDSDLPTSSGKASKPKLLGKLRRLLLGKSSRRNPGQTPPLDRTPLVDALPGRLSCDFPAGSPRVVDDAGGDDIMKPSRILSRSGSRRSFEVPRSYSRGNMMGPRRSNAEDSSTIANRIEALTEFESRLQDDDMLKFAQQFSDQKNEST